MQSIHQQPTARLRVVCKYCHDDDHNNNRANSIHSSIDCRITNTLYFILPLAPLKLSRTLSLSIWIDTGTVSCFHSRISVIKCPFPDWIAFLLFANYYYRSLGPPTITYTHRTPSTRDHELLIQVRVVSVGRLDSIVRCYSDWGGGGG